MSESMWRRRAEAQRARADYLFAKLGKAEQQAKDQAVILEVQADRIIELEKALRTANQDLANLLGANERLNRRTAEAEHMAGLVACGRPSLISEQRARIRVLEATLEALEEAAHDAIAGS